jgi:uncharacterized protein
VSPHPPPEEPLGPRATLLLALRAASWAMPVLVFCVVASRGLRRAWEPLGWLVPVVGVLVPLVACGPYALLRARRFRWALREQELELRHGAVWDVRTLVPVARVQHVDVRRTGASRALGLADLEVHTAAGTTRVPALADTRAHEARARLAELARAPDEL